ncbi:hypothetical protein [Streptomyces caniscabiei]|uniref:hypothetical protein n=1 Tax=Streptomyces caniscabiei TaxID=2746961 RepID=UPI0011814E37|nr:hypothetical protein [Streptomyces caniscabiei]
MSALAAQGLRPTDDAHTCLPELSFLGRVLVSVNYSSKEPSCPDDGSMTTRRIVLAVTCLAVAGLGVAFLLMRWDEASRLATVASALVAVAGLGVAIWAAVPGPGQRGLRVSDTGEARAAAGGTAVSGVTAGATGGTGDVGPVEVERTGPADATGGGDATSGIRLT